MDEAWTWGVLSALAALVSSAMIGIAPSIIDRSTKSGWWVVILAPLPLIIWNVLWVLMANPPDNVRRIVSIVIGAIAGSVILLGTTELIRGNAVAQTSTQSATPPNEAPPIQQFNNQGSGPQYNAPGGSIVLNTMPEKLRFTGDVADWLLKTVPRDQPLTVDAIGSPEDQEVGQRIAAFLNSKGYHIRCPPLIHLVSLGFAPASYQPWEKLCSASGHFKSDFRCIPNGELH